MTESVLCITTGGSIDKIYSAQSSSFIVGNPSVKGILRVARCGRSVRYHELCRKDSLELTDEDRSEILAKCKECSEKMIVIIHGTDTMNKTAAILKAEMIKMAKVVVITGAMKPEAFKDSDAAFNVGSAFALLPYLEPGAHVVFHSLVFSDPEQITKNEKKNTFEQVSSADTPQPTNAQGVVSTPTQNDKKRTPRRKSKDTPPTVSGGQEKNIPTPTNENAADSNLRGRGGQRSRRGYRRSGEGNRDGGPKNPTENSTPVENAEK
uniref:L-asparaginase N-terminal domain-containing protein n=1 Tax=Aureoumbra lagunensis TaxID=44058 RepID=A0A7S3JVH8_9STRA